MKRYCANTPTVMAMLGPLTVYIVHLSSLYTMEVAQYMA